MSTGININGIDPHITDVAAQFIETAARRGKRYQFVLYIEDQYLRIAQEHSPRFERYRNLGNVIGTYTSEIPIEVLAEDIMAEVEEVRSAQ